MNSVTFLMPAPGPRPVGGYKVVCEYANRLAATHHAVHIVYPAAACPERLTWRGRLRAAARYLYYRLTGRYSVKGWFPLHEGVREHFVRTLAPHRLPRTTCYVATAIQTARALRAYRAPGIRKFYLIQHFENWEFSDAEVLESYRYGYRNIAIASWLQRLVEAAGAPCELIHNGFDFDFFRMSVDYTRKERCRVAMLYHTSEWKGCRYGFEALRIVRERCPELKVSLFGVPPAPALPDWIEYFRQPDSETFNRIYNEAAIYLGPSLTEGWGLTVGEAMICGAAVVCTDNRGYREMAIDGRTALVAPVGDAAALAERILRLIGNDDERIRIARAGHRYIRRFTWEAAYAKFERLIDA